LFRERITLYTKHRLLSTPFYKSFHNCQRIIFLPQDKLKAFPEKGMPLAF